MVLSGAREHGFNTLVMILDYHILHSERVVEMQLAVGIFTRMHENYGQTFIPII